MSDERIEHNGRVYVPLASEGAIIACLLLALIGAGVSIYWLSSAIGWATRALMACP